MGYEFKREDAFSFAASMRIECKEKGDELEFKRCPYCDGGTGNKRDEWTFSINLNKGVFNCLRASCERQGHFVELCRDFDYKLEFEQPKIYRQLPQKRPETKPEAIKYLESRGISEKIARQYHITVQDNHPNILVFPFYDEDDRLVFVKYRKTDFRKGIDKNKEWCEKDTMPILFGMDQAKEYDKPLVITEGQCFDGKAEVLTHDGWIALENYAGQDVLQVDENMCGSFVRPKRFIVKRHVGKMVKVEIGGNYETYTTDDHNLVFIDHKGEVIKRKAIEKIATRYHIPTAVGVNENKHSDWSNEMFALYLAVSADGSIDHRKNTGNRQCNSDRYVRFGITLDRKAIRLREILDALHIERSDTITANGFISICFPCPDWLKSKYLPYWFATETTIEQKLFILNEMVLWDGNRVKGKNQYEYTTIIKHNADVMQLIASTCGYMSTIMSKYSGGNGNFIKSYTYKVSVLLGKCNVSTQQFEQHKVVTEVDQRVYCVTVDTGMILVRQNNRISVSGNCDSLSLAEAGIPNAVSVPTGASGFTWYTYNLQWMMQFKEIIVFGDCEHGHITLVDGLSARLPNDIIVKCVRQQDYLGEKDANDILQKYGPKSLRYAVEHAEIPRLDNIKQLADVQSMDINKMEKIKTGVDELDRCIRGMVMGQLIILTGKRGEGKSTFMSQIVAEALDQQKSVFVYSGELADFHFKYWLDLQLAGKRNVKDYPDQFGEKSYYLPDEITQKISNWYRGRAYIYDNNYLTEGSEFETLPETIEKVIRQYNVQLICIDNLMTAMEAVSEQSNLYLAQSNFVGQLKAIAVKYSVVIILVAHPRKASASDMMDDNDLVAGSSDITNKADVVLKYSRNTNEDYECDSLIKVTKSRLVGKLKTKNEEAVRVNYSPITKRITGTTYEETRGDKVYGWDDLGKKEAESMKAEETAEEDSIFPPKFEQLDSFEELPF